jgi:type I restriction-modification system DNA methylase subunit
MDEDIRKLIAFLAEDCGWPLEDDQIDRSAWPVNNAELGLNDRVTVDSVEIYELRPLSTNQPWGVFFLAVKGTSNLSMELLRKLLRGLVKKKRASADTSNLQQWNLEDLIFICSLDEPENTTRYVAHFEEQEKGLPKLMIGARWQDSQPESEIKAAKNKLKSNLKWPDDERDIATWKQQWSFPSGYKETVTTSISLSKAMAHYATQINMSISELFSIESDNGPVHNLFEAFKDGLVKDLKIQDFADMIAQTITYGLFSAKATGNNLTGIESLSESIPMTNPFLRDFFTCLTDVSGDGHDELNFDDLAIDELISMLNRSKIQTIVEDFGNQFREGREDPVIHFYEEFLSFYDKDKRKDRGVYYTPTPAVKYIVESVHNELIDNYGLQDGLADVSTWAQVAAMNPNIIIPNVELKSKEFVRILDPAVGTGTFLVEVIKKIHSHMKLKWEGIPKKEKNRLWSKYVRESLLPRLYGFEIMMAPFTIAHIKIGLVLQSTGYNLTNEEINILLTNSLEDSRKIAEYIPDFISKHNVQSEKAKKSYFTCVIGNPPYNVSSKNKNEWISSLIGDYKKGLNEQNINSLSDDYVKFIRLSHYHISRTGSGVIGMITNNSFLGNTIFDRMRVMICEVFNKISVINLHGDRLTDPKNDKNIFPIQKGVGIIILSIHSKLGEKSLLYKSILGDSSKKLKSLEKGLVSETWCEIDLQPPIFFVPVDRSNSVEYEFGISMPDIFEIFTTGINFRKDGLLVKNHFHTNDVVDMISDVNNLDIKYLSEKYNFKESKDWILRDKKVLFESYNLSDIRKVSYRPFDDRWAYYPLNKISKIIVRGDSRVSAAKHLTLLSENVAILCKRSRIINIDFFAHAQVISDLPDGNYFGDRTYFAPLYTVNDRYDSEIKTNFKSEFLNYMKNHLSVDIRKNSSEKQEGEISTFDIFSYIYALLNSSLYTNRYWPQLKIDYPRIQFTNSTELFIQLANYGNDLIAIQTKKKICPLSSKIVYSCPEPVNKFKISHDGNTIWLDSKNTHKLDGVSKEVWNFCVGSYKVCEQWLKSRFGKRGGKLLTNDITEFTELVNIIEYTLLNRKKIDDVIQNYGGVPLRGYNNSIYPLKQNQPSLSDYLQ